MKVASRMGLCLAILLFVNSKASAQSFELSFGGPDSLSGGDGAVVSTDYRCMLTPGDGLDGEGAQGWSLSIGSDDATAITAITVDGSIGAEDPDGLRDGGFEKSETTSGDGNNGAVSAVVLSFTQPITAPAEGASVVAVISVDATISDGGTATLEYVDGRQGSGQPVNNNVTHKGATVKPDVVSKEIALELSVECSKAATGAGALAVLLDAEGATQPDPEGPVQITVGPGGTIFAAINSNELASGVQGWSLSVAVGGDISLEGATTDGTMGAEDPDGLRDGGFEKTEVVDPAVDAQGAGAVSAVVLSFTQPITLDPTSCVNVLALTVGGELGSTGTVSFKDGLRGSGQPVNSVATVGGGTSEFQCAQSADVLVDITQASYQAGNANGDLRLDIADPIWIINELFRDGPMADCQEANDANSDGLVDLSDATFLIDYLFLAGQAPASNDGGCLLAEEGSDCVSQAACN